jgi:hypothetical protein
VLRFGLRQLAAAFLVDAGSRQLTANPALKIAGAGPSTAGATSLGSKLRLRRIAPVQSGSKLLHSKLYIQRIMRQVSQSFPEHETRPSICEI